jgi:hypothetical protein
MRLIFAVIILFCQMATDVGAKEVRYLIRSPKALLMGDAYTSHADDDYTLFYNPAGLGRSKLVELRPINPDFGFTNILGDMDRLENFPKDAPGIADRIMGYPVYVHGGATPGLKFGPVAFNMFVSSSTSLVLRNRVYPQIDIDYRLDRGFAFGYAYSFGQGGKFEKRNPFEAGTKKSAKGTDGVRTSIGASVKNINRQGLVGSYSLFGSTLLNAINENKNDVGQLRDALGYSKGKGWGVDFGVEHAYVMGSSELAFGASVLDIGGTNFRREQGTADIPEQEMMVNGGVSWRQDFFLLDYSLALDFKPLNVDMPFARKLHFGAEVGIPLVRLLFGFSEGYVSYGVEVDVWLIKVTAGFYSVELGRDFKEEQGKRALVYVSLLEFDFDL